MNDLLLRRPGGVDLAIKQQGYHVLDRAIREGHPSIEKLLFDHIAITSPKDLVLKNSRY